ncbi:MAG: AraC-like DNA-binding protein [Kiritimatiellia bacterium]|jgi:AraC-like DNA-binding protein
MDTLSTLLKGTHLSARVTNTGTVHAPWGLVNGASGATIFHVVAHGVCWLLADGQTIQLRAGQAVLLPRGAAHALVDQPDTPPSPLRVCPAQDERPVADVTVDGGGDACRLVCGLVTLDGPFADAVKHAMPEVLIVRPEAQEGLGFVLRQLAHEAFDTRPGSSAILDGLAQLLFLYVLRRAVDHAGAGVLAGLGHEGLRRALRALHETPGRDWDLTAMARTAGMSRTAFAGRFATDVGQTPAAYLRSLRLDLAGQRVRTGLDGLDQIADDLGYNSAAALSRAFKVHHGVSPRAWRASKSVSA